MTIYWPTPGFKGGTLKLCENDKVISLSYLVFGLTLDVDALTMLN